MQTYGTKALETGRGELCWCIFAVVLKGTNDSCHGAETVIMTMDGSNAPA
jgi:hypothetical protein